MKKVRRLAKEVVLSLSLVMIVLSLSGCCTPTGSACTEDADCCVGLMCDNGVCSVDPCYMSFSGFGAYMPNPASVYCGRIGGELRIEDSPDGQYGICTLPDGTEHDEWELYCDDCEDTVSCRE